MSFTMQQPSTPLRKTAAIWLPLVAALAACSGGDASKGGAGGGGGGHGMPPPTVGVVTVQPADVPLVTELPGRLEAWRTAQVRARVPGIVAKRLFTEGSEVKAGQPLFQLDDAALRATVASAEAAVARADAAVAQAQAQVQRNQPLAEAKAISAQEWLQTQTTLKSAQADAATARAALQSARINLGYAAITAPISGRIGRSLVTEGALVGQGDATQMALIQQTGTLYVNFTQSASEVLHLRKAFASGKLQKAAGSNAAEVRVVLDDGSVYPQAGKLLFTDPAVDAATGQVSLRAELPNPQGTLLPGLFVKVRLVQATTTQAIKLPQQAVTRGAGGDTVLVVGPDNKPAPRQITVAAAQGGDWVVTSGLKAGDRVIVDGVQKMMMAPGSPVNAVPWVPGGQGASGHGGAPGGAPGGAASAPAGALAASAAPAAASR
jgi:membrane fusion protein (multidrug efflux system)